ncbi:aldo/keto reductase [Agromyces subbeticus]|uniref:aldo/keto reductase n=1 Tax=Agromyces subbeticus TaxID=293890 RepID=UPI0012EBD60A|nr:aldo/keto reductase [Agromyces subbeticus]
MRTIGNTSIEVSELSLGSWNTYSRLSFEANVELINHAYRNGINFFDVAYYRDKPHTEVLFGRMLQEAEFSREDIVLAEKVWFFDYPERSLAAQLDQTLRRLAVNDVDVIIVEHPRDGMDVAALATEAAGLVTSGRAKAWGGLNWRPELILEAFRHCREQGLPTPELVQLKYSVVRQNVVDGPEYSQVLAETGISVHTSDTLEGGMLTGNLTPVRKIGLDIGGIREEIRRRVPAVQEAAASLGVTAAEFAIAFAISKPEICSLLFGATRPEQVDANLRGLELAHTRAAEVRGLAKGLGVDAHEIDPPYGHDAALTDEFVA